MIQPHMAFALVFWEWETSRVPEWNPWSQAVRRERGMEKLIDWNMAPEPSDGSDLEGPTEEPRGRRKGQSIRRVVGTAAGGVFLGGE